MSSTSAPVPAKYRRGSPAYRRFSAAMLLAGLATFAVFYCVQPLLPLFSHSFALSAEESSLAVSVTLGPMALLLPAAGALSDRIGRRRLMVLSLFPVGMVTLFPAIAPHWPVLLAARLLCGLFLAGVPAIAMVYIAEEVDESAIGHAMGLYIAGTALGGMSGRVLGSLVAQFAGWRASLGFVGATIMMIALLFWRCTPKAAHFIPRDPSVAGYVQGLKRLLNDRVTPCLYAQAFLLMGAFMSIYNYVTYRLVAPPYELSQTAVGAVFLLYILGSMSSTWAGAAASRLGARSILRLMLLLFLGGIGFTMARPLALIILGLAIVTIGFFGAHSVLSAWTARRAGVDRAQSASLYLLFYYMGGSVLGSASGVAWTHDGWTGVAACAGLLITLGAGISAALTSEEARATRPARTAP